MRKKEDYKSLIVLLVFGMLSAVALTMGSYVLNNQQNLISRAFGGCFCPSGSDKCYPDGCTRKTIQPDGTIDYNRCGNSGCNGAYNSCYDTSNVEVNRYFCLEQPPCCAEMVQRNDPEACCWPERGYCHPVSCNQVSRPEQCGWYWSFHDGATPNGYGCMIGDSPSTMSPVFGLPEVAGGSTPTSTPVPTTQQQPTNTPIPSNTPQPTNTPVPVATNTPIPPTPGQPTNTSVPVPTNTSVPIPTNKPQQNQPTSPPQYNPQPTNATPSSVSSNEPTTYYLPPTSAPIEIRTPKEIARDVINQETIQILNETTEKPLNAPKQIVNSVKEWDKALERKLESWFFPFRVKLFQFIQKNIL